MKKTIYTYRDKVFDPEATMAPIEAETGYQRADRSWWENNVLLVVVALAMAALDMMFLFDMLDLVMQQNEILGKIGSFGIALILNFLPLVIAKQINKARYRLDNKSWLFALIGIVLFAALYAVVVLLRFNCLQLYTTSISTNLINTIEVPEVVVYLKSSELERRPLLTAVLLSVEPLATSGFSFALAILTDNPLKKQIHYLERRILEIDIARNRITAALASMWEDKQFLLNTDESLYYAAIESIDADANRLMKEARLMLAERLGDPSSISKLSADNQDKKRFQPGLAQESPEITIKHIA